MMKRRIAALTFVLAMLAGAAASSIPLPGRFCDGSNQLIYGAGSLLQDDLHQRLFVPEYETACPKGIGTIRHLKLGQQAGFQALQDHNERYPLITVDRALTLLEETTAENDYPARRGRFSQIAHMPLFITPTAVLYNPPCSNLPPLQVSSTALSQIFTGAILRWNDPVLVQDNPSLANCATTMKVAIRIDDTPTTTTLKDYLSKRNPQWNAYTSGTLANQWPATLLDNCQAYGEAAMTACMGKGPGYIGYATYATMSLIPGLKALKVENAGEAFVAPNTGGCSVAAQEAYNDGRIPRDGVFGDWTQVSLTDGDTGYPMCNFSYALAYIYLVTGYFGQVSLGQMRTLSDYLDVALRPTTQAKLTAKGFTPLPADILQVSRDGWSQLEFH